MVRGKTAAMFRGSCEVGALLGGADDRQAAALASYGERLGIAFQMVDDLLAYRSSNGAAGKDLRSDIRNRRMTFPLIVACLVGPAAIRRTLQELFDRTGVSDEEGYRVVRDLLDRTGAIAEATRIVEQHARAALDCLGVLARSRSRDRLAALVNAAVERVA
jgi:geranylgeranyl diphosphate synthase type I